jgi:proton-dependent oligopeptide transporter, POT family
MTIAIKEQPQVLLLSIIISAFERFGFYILADSLVLYLENHFGFLDTEANIFYSTLNALAYTAPAIGGYLADNFFGIRRSIILGLIIEGLGQMCLVLPDKVFLYLGISLIITGVGFFKVSPTNLMARAYSANDLRIDNGYTLFYMAMNLGSVSSAILAGFLQRYFGWHIIFIVASIGIYLGLVFYYFLRHRAKDLDVSISRDKLSLSSILFFAGCLICFIALIAFLMDKTFLVQTIFYSIAGIVIIYFLYEIYRNSLEEKKKIIACLLLIVIGMAFFMMYFQRYTSVFLFIDRSVERNLFGLDIPSIAMLALNPLWIVALGPILVSLYNFLHKKGKVFPVTSKFSLGLLMISLSFFFLRISIYFANDVHKVSFIWIVLVFGFYSLGELLVSALGVAMVARIAPRGMYGVMMGAWFLLATSIGSMLGGKVANIAAIPKGLTDPIALLDIYGQTFLKIGVVGLLISLLAFLAAPHIKRIANL